MYSYAFTKWFNRNFKSYEKRIYKRVVLNRAAKLRALVPNLRITTDIIVAFPGETQKDFEDTFDVVNQVKFDQILTLNTLQDLELKH